MASSLFASNDAAEEEAIQARFDPEDFAPDVLYTIHSGVLIFKGS
jgi:hypothetical protein